MTEKPNRTVGAVLRAASVLRLFADSPGPLGVTEIARQLNLSKAVVHRILASFREFELIELNVETRQYDLGPGVLGLGRAYLKRIDIREIARDALERLSSSTLETATYSVRHGGYRVYVDQVTPAREVHMSVPIGQPFPLHAGSSSKAFLAFLPEEEREEYLRRELEPITNATIIDPGLMHAELERIRKRGYARSVGERQAGAASVGAPIFDQRGEPVGVLSVCGPAERFRKDIEHHVDLLMKETRSLSQRLGFD